MKKILSVLTLMMFVSLVISSSITYAWPASYTVGGSEFNIVTYGAKGNIEGQNPYVASGWSAAWVSVEHNYGQGYAAANNQSPGSTSNPVTFGYLHKNVL